MHKIYASLIGIKESNFNISGIDGCSFYHEFGSGNSENYYQTLGDRNEFGIGAGKNGLNGSGYNNNYHCDFYPKLIVSGDGKGYGENILAGYFYYAHSSLIKQEEFSFIEESNA